MPTVACVCPKAVSAKADMAGGRDEETGRGRRGVGVHTLRLVKPVRDIKDSEEDSVAKPQY